MYKSITGKNQTNKQWAVPLDKSSCSCGPEDKIFFSDLVRGARGCLGNNCLNQQVPMMRFGRLTSLHFTLECQQGHMAAHRSHRVVAPPGV